MYQVYANGVEITNRYDINQTIHNAKLTLKVNEAGYLVFTIYPDHHYYDQIKPLTTRLMVKKGQDIIFKGRVIAISPIKLDGRKTVEVEGNLAFLNDTFIEPFEYSGSVKGYLNKILTEHNKRVDSSRKLKMGTVTVTDPNDYIVRSSINFLSSWEAINSRLIELLGGYIIVRYTENETIINYFEDSDRKTNQKIILGQNLLDHESHENALELITALVPLGARLEDEDGQQTEDRLTVEYVNNGSKVIYNPEAVEKYGYIYGVKTWDDITKPRNLLNTARKYLNERVAIGQNMKVSAIDLSSIEQGMDDLSFFTYVTVINPLYEIETDVLITEKTINISNPSENTVSFGSDDASITKNNIQMGDILSNINNTYITSTATRKENVWLEWLSLELEGGLLNVVFNKEYKTRPSVTFDFTEKTSGFNYDFEYMTEDAEGTLLYSGVTLKITSGSAKTVNMVAVGRY